MKLFLPIFACLIIALGCEKENIEPTSYFPLDEGTEWCYGNYFEGESNPFSQANWKIQGDTTIEGKVYKQLTFYGESFKAIREENGNFYKRRVNDFVNTTPEELLFLKTDNPNGATWEQTIDDQKYVFSQIVLSEVLVNDIIWKDIIEVRIALFYKNVNGEFEPFLDYLTNEIATARYDFARGKGLVSVYEPAEFNHFSDFAYSVSNYMEIMECP